jgi:ribosomal protein S21
MRLLKSKMKKEHVIEDYKKHLRYEKPSDRMRKQQIESRKRARRMQRIRDL